MKIIHKRHSIARPERRGMECLLGIQNAGMACPIRHHDDVIKWKHFQRYWAFVRGIHRSPAISPHKGPVTQSFDVFFDLCLNKRLNKQSRRRWFETPSRPLWRHCNDCHVPCTSVMIDCATRGNILWRIVFCLSKSRFVIVKNVHRLICRHVWQYLLMAYINAVICLLMYWQY